MTDLSKIQIQTIYSEDSADDAGSSWRLHFVGALTTLVGAFCIYGIFFGSWLPWNVFPMFDWVTQKIVFAGGSVFMGGGAPADSPNDDVNSFFNMLGGAPAANTEEAALNREQMQQAGQKLAIGGYGWLAWMALLSMGLVGSGVAGVTRGHFRSLWFKLLFPLALAGVVLLVWYLWKEYEFLETIMPKWAKPALTAGLGLTSGLMGLALNRFGRGLLRFAGVAVIFSGALTVGLLWYLRHEGLLPPAGGSWQAYTQIFLAQSAYGWIMLIALIRIR